MPWPSPCVCRFVSLSVFQFATVVVVCVWSEALNPRRAPLVCIVDERRPGDTCNLNVHCLLVLEKKRRGGERVTEPIIKIMTCDPSHPCVHHSLVAVMIDKTRVRGDLQIDLREFYCARCREHIDILIFTILCKVLCLGVLHFWIFGTKKLPTFQSI